MGTSIEIVMPEPQVGAGDGAATLSRFLRMLASDSSCFCCGSPTDLMLDGTGLLSVRCPDCRAEISAAETGCGEESEPVLQAA